jgi:hypothetical protein
MASVRRVAISHSDGRQIVSDKILPEIVPGGIPNYDLTLVRGDRG